MTAPIKFFPVDSEMGSGPRGTASSQTIRPAGCHACGRAVQFRVLARLTETDDNHVEWCVCPCELREASVIRVANGTVSGQSPPAAEFRPSPKWPADLAKLYAEAVTAAAAGAHTAAAMVARKVLMAVACREGDAEGKTFAAYVDYIMSNVLTFPRARDAIDGIRTIGNDANHKLAFVSPEQSRRALDIVTYLLNVQYAVPGEP